GDHSDVMAARQTGFALLASSSVQEAQDMALVCQAATLQSRVPFLHFFDGFRTSREINKIKLLDDDTLRTLIDLEQVRAHRARALTPDRPVLRGSAQNPDVYFQGREAVNPFYLACPGIVQDKLDLFARLTGRAYRLFDYEGAPDAERVLVLMGSGAETAMDTARRLVESGEKVGVLKVRLYRPFSVEHFVKALPATVKSIAVLDRCKEPGATGEPLYQDVLAALAEGWDGDLPRVSGGRYGLASKEFTPAMVKAVFDELDQPAPKTHFTVGIHDDVTHTSLDIDPHFSVEDPETIRCVFWGLGSDGTVGANKNSIKIIGEETPFYAQGYYYNDSKKAGTVTISHLRFGPHPIRAPYLIQQANFVACHQSTFMERYDVLACAAPGAVFLLNSIYPVEEVWDHLPQEAQQTILAKKLRMFVIDAYAVAGQAGMGQRINTIMQTCFFAISGVLPREQAIRHIKDSIQKTYGKRGPSVVQQNFAAVDMSLENLHAVAVPGQVTSQFTRPAPVPQEAPEFVRNVLAPMIALQGEDIPVSAMPVDGTFPTGTARWEKRNIALSIPVWEPELCIQCGKCTFVCPHAAIRGKVYAPDLLDQAPQGFLAAGARWKEFPGQKYSLQVAPEDCTGCGLCVEICPAVDKQQPEHKALSMAPQPPLRQSTAAHWEFFLSLPEVDRTALSLKTVKNAALLQPLFEFSGACSGCGETPYVRLLSQLFGDRILVANATGCSSIYGGNLPTTPWTRDAHGRGPAWSNSLFEDNAEFGLGMRLSLDQQCGHARELLSQAAGRVGNELAQAILNADQSHEDGIQAQRQRIARLKEHLEGSPDPADLELLSLADGLVRKSVWIVGGDGWAYDIGYGGLDHVLASGRNVNLLVLDTEVYSNTGGQASKATSRAAVARFAAQGKGLPKKDLGLMAMSYGYVYVARVALGGSDQQTLAAFQEADAYDGPSLIIAYAHCIEHGIEMQTGLSQQKRAVQSGYWPLYRYHPERAAAGQNPLVMDSKAPSIPLESFAYQENRFRSLLQANEQRAEALLEQAQSDVQARWERYRHLAAAGQGGAGPDKPAAGD
ncbi:MAG: pyruvate:ferredoxin (flavodoxin) oxidoreductase, partial [Chloroflexi bacterium]|nr:pyruvate:ferredoxin (flavodoxin) oxidoreductase [Chloroflexota bacterium]